VDPGFPGEDGRQRTTTPWGLERAVLQGGLRNEALEVLCQLTGECGRSPRARAIPHALRPRLRKALSPRAEGGLGHVERLRDGVDMMAGHDLTDGLRPAQDPRCLGLLEQGV
jgi:hypothetical protein